MWRQYERLQGPQWLGDWGCENNVQYSTMADKIRVATTFSIYHTLNPKGPVFSEKIYKSSYGGILMAGPEQRDRKGIRAVAVSGSRHEGGKTETILKQWLRRLSDVGVAGELIAFHWKTIFPCVACGNCWDLKKPICSLDDDFEELFRKVREADFVLLGAPGSGHGFSTGFQVFLKRARRVACAGGDCLSGKLCVIICSDPHSSRSAGFDMMLSWAYGLGMILVGYTPNEDVIERSRFWKEERGGHSVLLDRRVERLIEIGDRLFSHKEPRD